MAITFDPVNKIIQLDKFVVSEKELWTAFVNWSVLGDNLKYGCSSIHWMHITIGRYSVLSAHIEHTRIKTPSRNKQIENHGFSESVLCIFYILLFIPTLPFHTWRGMEI